MAVLLDFLKVYTNFKQWSLIKHSGITGVIIIKDIDVWLLKIKAINVYLCIKITKFTQH